MSYKLAMLLSTVFLVSVFLLGGDLCLINATYQTLDAMSLTVNQRISREGQISQDTLSFVENNGANFVSVTSGTPAIGETYVYRLEKEYQPLVIKKSTMKISVTRSCVVGFYKN